MEVSLKPSKLHFAVDGMGTVSSTCEIHVMPTMNMTLSGKLNHAESKQNFGIGFSMHA